MVTICKTLGPDSLNYFKYVTVNQNVGCCLMGTLQVPPHPAQSTFQSSIGLNNVVAFFQITDLS